MHKTAAAHNSHSQPLKHSQIHLGRRAQLDNDWQMWLHEILTSSYDAQSDINRVLFLSVSVFLPLCLPVNEWQARPNTIQTERQTWCNDFYAKQSVSNFHHVITFSCVYLSCSGRWSIKMKHLTYWNKLNKQCQV